VTDRAPPHSLDAERCLLGCLMLFPQESTATCEALAPTDFYWEPHQHIHGHLKALVDAGRPFDLEMLAEALRVDGRLEAVGGKGYIWALADESIGPATMEYHAFQVLRFSKLRQLNAVAADIQRGIYALGADPQALLDNIEQQVFAIAERGESGEAVHIGGILRTLADDLKAGKGLDRGLSTGFLDVDDALRGLHRGQLIILAARPSIGKTSMALTMAMASAKTVPVLLFSLEMAGSELAYRIIAENSEVSAWQLRGHNCGLEMMHRAAAAAEEVSNADLYVDAEASAHINDIRSRTRRMVARRGIGLVVVDYLQLVRGNRKPGDSREQEVASISRGLKRLASECDVPVLALSQLRRQPPGSKMKPRLDELRESGSLEQDADVVLLLHREDIYKSTEAELRIAKQRHGPTKIVSLVWNPGRVRFENSAKVYVQQAMPEPEDDDGGPF